MAEITRTDNDIRLFKLLTTMPHHTAGDLLYLPHVKADHCIWVDEPFYKVDLWVMENSPKDFEELFNDYKTGDDLYYIDPFGNVITDYFHAPRHSKLIRFGNAYKTIESAEWVREQFRKLISEKGQVLLKADFYQLIQTIQDNDSKIVIQLIKDKYLY